MATADIASTGTPPNYSKDSTGKKTARWIAERILDLLAIGGVVCIIAVAAAFFFNITLVLFKTGSMSPAIPTGSVAVVQKVPASDVEVGDVITVDRTGQLPITHRVISTKPLGDSVYSIEMKGDANDGPDPRPYEITEARKVLWSIPEMGKFIAMASTPLVMGAATMSLTLLVIWAFWPRGRKD